jgi:hypothetical protein
VALADLGDVHMSRLQAQCMSAAAEWAGRYGSSPDGAGASESPNLRLIFKVFKSLSIIVALSHDGREAMDFSTVLALHCPALSAAACPAAGDGVARLTRVEVCGATSSLPEGRRCAMHAVGDALVIIPHEVDSSLDLANIHVMHLSAGQGAGGGIRLAAEVRHVPVDAAMARDDVTIFVHENKLLLLPNTRGACSSVCVLYPDSGRYQLYALDYLNKVAPPGPRLPRLQAASDACLCQP